MEEVAEEHKAAYEVSIFSFIFLVKFPKVFERESGENGTIYINQLPDVLRMTNLVVTETFLLRQKKRLGLFSLSTQIYYHTSVTFKPRRILTP